MGGGGWVGIVGIVERREETKKRTISNSSSRSSYSTFSSTSSNPPANAPHRSGVGQCQMRTFPVLVVEAIAALFGCHYSIFVFVFVFFLGGGCVNRIKNKIKSRM